MTPKEERDRWIRVGLEANFAVWGPDQNEEGRGFDVVDAECHIVASCDDEELARIIVDALTRYDRAMWAAVPMDDADVLTEDMYDLPRTTSTKPAPTE